MKGELTKKEIKGATRHRDKVTHIEKARYQEQTLGGREWVVRKMALYHKVKL